MSAEFIFSQMYITIGNHSWKGPGRIYNNMDIRIMEITSWLHCNIALGAICSLQMKCALFYPVLVIFELSVVIQTFCLPYGNFQWFVVRSKFDFKIKMQKRNLSFTFIV